MTYEYYITMQWVNTDENGNSDKFDIGTENINMLVMHNDYAEALMPTIYAKLSLDKKNVDKIVQYAKTASIYMNISKMQKEDNSGNTSYAKILTQYNGEMSYFISKDINYNKEIDYTEEGGNKDKNDVFETFSIGLMFKECIEANKQTNNTTLINTNPFNAVLSYMQAYPAVVEQFTYNETFDQLIVPPQESLYDTVKFFNDVAVLYDTPFRFYIEPGCVYLLSSSGAEVPKQGETYSSVLFNVHAVTSTDANAEGMVENSKDSVYYVDINVKDTKYTTDNDTMKVFNDIATIIDPSKNNSITLLSQVNSVINKINGLIGDVTGMVDKTIDSIKNIPSQIYDWKGIFNTDTAKAIQYTNEIVDATNKAIAAITDMPTSDTSGGSGEYWIDSKVKEEYLKQLEQLRDDIVAKSGSIGQINTIFNNASSLLTKSMSNLTNIGSYFGGISAINLTDNLTSTFKKIANIKADIGEHDRIIEVELTVKVNDVGNILLSTQEVIRLLTDISNHYNLGGSAAATDPVAPYIEQLQFRAEDLSEVSSNISNTLVKYNSESIKIKSLEQAIEPTIKQFDTFNTDIKSGITGIVNDIRTIGDTAKKCLDSIVNSAKDIVNSVSSLDFSIDSLDELQENINAVRDISKIGRLGISSFVANLSLSGTTTTSRMGTGTKIVRVANDNVNMIKNIKADIENHIFQLTLNKNGLDTSVFTPNKKYVVKNYDAHSDRNGVFLLARKTDMFVRHSDRYTLNTRMEFNKVRDESKANAVSKVLNAKDWEEVVRNAEEILRREKNGITLDNLADVVKNADAIYKIYRS